MRTTLLLLLTFCLVAPLASAQDEFDMAAMMEMIAPDEHHVFLRAFVGDWYYHSFMWMAPDAPPVQTLGEASLSMDLDGRYLVGVHTGNFMGMPFEGRGTTGYDKVSGKYVLSWVDNIGTSIMLFEGQVEDGKLVVESDLLNPTTGTNEVHKMVQWADGETYTMEYYTTPEGGDETLSMRIISTRVED